MNLGKTLRAILTAPLILTLLCSCAKDQSFTIVSAYEGVAEYVEVSQSEPDPDLEALFRKYVVDPYWEDCASGGEYDLLAEEVFEAPIRDLDSLTEEARLLRSSGVEEIVEEALHRVSTFLPGPDTTVCIYVLDPHDTFARNYMHGVSGRTVGSGKILIQVSPHDDWRDWVPYSVAHEYHHSVWTSRHFEGYEGQDLVDYLIFEGRADSFARLVYPDLNPPWTDALSIEQEAEVWEVMQDQLDTTNYAIKRRFMFGGGRSVPRWAGYTIGFHIVQAFLRRHPEASVDKWTTMDAHDIYSESGYDGRH
jgi:uncharacterized protein YjaZ